VVERGVGAGLVDAFGSRLAPKTIGCESANDRLDRHRRAVAAEHTAPKALISKDPQIWWRQASVPVASSIARVSNPLKKAPLMLREPQHERENLCETRFSAHPEALEG
jgi:hypothetical protein